MTNEELDEILTSLNANMETASVMRHLRAENEKLREALRIFVWAADELFVDERYQKLLRAADKILESGE